MFKFPLQRLLELREQREQAMARELAQARAAAEASRERHDALTAARDDAQARTGDAAGDVPTVGQLVSQSYASAQLGERIQAAHDAVEEADAKVDERRTALTSASQDRQVLDRLRSRRLDEYRTDAAQLEQNLMDAIALTRHRAAPVAPKENKA